MSLRPAGRLAIIILPALVAAACSTAAVPPAAAPGNAPAAAASIPADSAAALEARYRARMEQARGRFTEADVRFMTDMIGHHAQAVLMANMAATRARSPAVQTLAARIRSGQSDEIGLMQQWLRERGRPVPPVDLEADTPAAHAGHAAHDVAAMPGMLGTPQLQELAQASGADFDRLFLTRMIEHHRGAVVMVETLLAADGAAQDPAVFRLASDVHVDQLTEIARMQRMLAALLGGSGSR
jgi:uncharacterized protein (DUF305 family)